jgi:hypothetical protein
MDPRRRKDLDLAETEREVQIGYQRYREARKLAEEVVRDLGWNEKDDDFHLQIEEETKRRWDELYKRDMHEEFFDEEEDEFTR